MAPEEFKRKLTAILSADVEGYSRLMGDDEDATIRTLTTYRELMATLIQKHRGRVVDTPGDNLLAGFGLLCQLDVLQLKSLDYSDIPDRLQKDIMQLLMLSLEPYTLIERKSRMPQIQGV